MKCPVLTHATALRFCYAIPGTDHMLLPGALVTLDISNNLISELPAVLFDFEVLRYAPSPLPPYMLRRTHYNAPAVQKITDAALYQTPRRHEQSTFGDRRGDREADGAKRLLFRQQSARGYPPRARPPLQPARPYLVLRLRYLLFFSRYLLCFSRYLPMRYPLSV